MTISDLEHFKNLLLEKEHSAQFWLESIRTTSKKDISAVRNMLMQINDALGRVENGTYGQCRVCKGEVEHYRLEVQPITEVCLDCISRQEKSQLEEELYLAGKIHRALLPQNAEVIDGFEVAVKSLAARTVGGDYYDFLNHPSGEVRIIVADTMGKGIPAGLMMSNIQGTLRILAEDQGSTGQLLARLNRILCRNLPVTKFVSMVCLSITPGDVSNGSFSYANAGHNPPMLLKPDGNLIRLEPTGGVLGVHDEFEFETRQMPLSSRDLLVLYTDGITEAEDGSGNMYSEKRLADWLKLHRSEPAREVIDGLLKDVGSFSKNGELEDDSTLLVLRRL